MFPHMASHIVYVSHSRSIAYYLHTLGNHKLDQGLKCKPVSEFPSLAEANQFRFVSPKSIIGIGRSEEEQEEGKKEKMEKEGH